MQPEEKELLKKTIELEKENNNILRSIQRSMRLARIMTIVYWVFLIASALGIYYFLQPYLDQIKDIYGGAKTSFSSVGEFFDRFGSGTE